MALTYPLINGIRFSFASIELSIAGTKYVGVSEISYSHTLEPGEVRGAHAQVLGYTKGDYVAEGSMTMYKEEWETLRKGLGEGWMEKSIDVITVTYAEVGNETVVDKLVSVRIVSTENSISQGPDPASVTITLKPLYIEEGSQKPINKMLTGNQ